jgi:SynChlorMet cassette radical SAM/SPASM protein ScmE
MIVRFRAPVSVFLNVTYRCNLSCVYCSADAGPARRDELDPAELRRIVDELIACGVRRVIVTGGEPFVRSDLFDVLTALRQARVVVHINTNGTLLRESTCERLRDLRIAKIAISLDGVGDVNDITRGRGSAARTARGIRALVAVGVRPTLLLTLTRHNVEALEPAVAECRRLGAAAVSINPLSPVGRGTGCYDGLRLTPDEWESAAHTIRRLQAEYPRFVQADFLHWSTKPQALERAAAATREGRPPRARYLLPCDAAKAFCAITPDGSVLPCNKFDTYRCGSLREESLLAIWQGDAMERIRRLGGCAVAQTSVCASCRYHVVCSGGCRAEAYRAFGRLDAPDPACALLPDAAVHALTPADTCGEPCGVCSKTFA